MRGVHEGWSVGVVQSWGGGGGFLGRVEKFITSLEAAGEARVKGHVHGRSEVKAGMCNQLRTLLLHCHRPPFSHTVTFH